MSVFEYRSCDREIFTVFEKHYVSVFGGYIRDVIAGVSPNDIDCCVEQDRLQVLKDDLILLGYTITQDEGIYVGTHDNLPPLEIIVAESDVTAKEYYLGPATIPDYSVNMLAYGRDYENNLFGLYVWTCDATVDSVIKNIRLRICYKHPDNTSEYEEYMKPREAKILSKGYQIVLM